MSGPPGGLAGSRPVRSPVTVEAPANIAFVKYWGTRDEERVVPANPSISMTLSRCVTVTSVEAVEGLGADEVWLAADDGALGPAPVSFATGVARHLERLRRWAGDDRRCRVATRNSFPAGTGMASSASGFAALALAAAGAFGRSPSPAEASVLARLSGSGSAARSVLGGFVEWPAGEGESEGYARSLAPAGHWTLCDVVAVVDEREKTVSSREGHRRAASSPHFTARLAELPGRLAAVRGAIAERSLERLGPVLEEEAVELHLVAMSSRPPIFYWRPATLGVHAAVRSLRAAGVGAWFTMDAGANVHVICQPPDETAVAERVATVPGVARVIRDRTGAGPRRIEEHLL